MGNYQEFTLLDDKMPGFNEVLDAAKSFGTRTTKKLANSYTGMKRNWMLRITDVLKKEKIHPIETIYLSMLWLEPNKRRDPDNIASFIKFILDGLQAGGIIKNDGWAQVKGWENRFVISQKRGVTVRIYDAAKRYNLKGI